MATTQQGGPAKSPVQKGKGAKPPITAHPAFPLVVAMWFAALLGLGTFILPVELFETLVTTLGIPALVPAAAPPLGMTGRLAIALFALVAGALLGLWVARKAAPAAPETARRRAFSVAQDGRRQPLSAHEDLGSAGFDSVADFASTRRRALAMEDEGRRSDFLTVAPLPGQDDGHGFGRDFDLRDAAQAAQIQYDHISSARRPASETSFGEPLDLEEFAEFTEQQEFAGQMPSEPQEIDMTGKQVFSPSKSTGATYVANAMYGAEDTHEADFAAEPLPFSPPSMIRRNVEPEQVEKSVQHTEEPEVFGAPAPVAEPEVAQTLAFAPPVAPIAADIAATHTAYAEPAADLDLVQLVDRLGATLEKHREWTTRQAELASSSAHFPRIAAPVAVDLADFGMAAPHDAAKAMASFFAEPDSDVSSEAAEIADDATPIASEPAKQVFAPVQSAQTGGPVQGFQPFAGLGRIDGHMEHEDDDEDHLSRLAASFTLPLEGASQAPAETVQMAPVPVAYSPSFDEFAAEPLAELVADEVTELGEVAEDDASYPSLLEMKNPFRDQRPEFVRVEEPEPDAPRSAVIFPHEEAAAVPAQPVSAAEPAEEAKAANDMRSFDPPASAASRSAAASAENERVLREALMNLQRIKSA